MPFDITTFASELSGSGSRPNLFEITLVFPPTAPNTLASRKITYMAKAASLPPDHLGTISQFYFGRELKYPGDRRFEPWTIQIINDEDSMVRDAFETWSSALNSHEGNLRSQSSATPSGYKVQATVTQFTKTGEPGKVYTMKGVWPSDVSPIELSWESADSIAEFSVTLNYDWWTSNTTD